MIFDSPALDYAPTKKACVKCPSGTAQAVRSKRPRTRKIGRPIRYLISPQASALRLSLAGLIVCVIVHCSGCSKSGARINSPPYYSIDAASAADPTFAGVTTGWYTIHITCATKSIPARYNTVTTLGCEVAMDANWVIEGEIKRSIGDSCGSPSMESRRAAIAAGFSEAWCRFPGVH